MDLLCRHGDLAIGAVIRKTENCWTLPVASPGSGLNSHSSGIDRSPIPATTTREPYAALTKPPPRTDKLFQVYVGFNGDVGTE